MVNDAKSLGKMHGVDLAPTSTRVCHTFGEASEQLFPASETHREGPSRPNLPALALWCVVQLSTHLKPDSWGK